MGFDTAAVDEFSAKVRGDVLRSSDERFANACRLWNGMIERHPALIVRPVGVADMVTAVRFAREQQLPLSVRGRGHNVAGNALCDDGLVVDLSRMRQVRVDPVRVQRGSKAAPPCTRVSRGLRIRSAEAGAARGSIRRHEPLQLLVEVLHDDELWQRGWLAH